MKKGADRWPGEEHTNAGANRSSVNSKSFQLSARNSNAATYILLIRSEISLRKQYADASTKKTIRT